MRNECRWVGLDVSSFPTQTDLSSEISIFQGKDRESWPLDGKKEEEEEHDPDGKEEVEEVEKGEEVGGGRDESSSLPHDIPPPPKISRNQVCFVSREWVFPLRWTDAFVL